MDLSEQISCLKDRDAKKLRIPKNVNVRKSLQNVDLFVPFIQSPKNQIEQLPNARSQTRRKDHLL